MDGSAESRQTQHEAGVEGSTRIEAGTLQWSRDRETGGEKGKGDRMSVRSGEAASCTESEKESNGEKKWTGLMDDGEGSQIHLENPMENHLPEKAAQVFSPAVNLLPNTSPHKESEVLWEMQSERSPFLGPRGLHQDYNQHGFQDDWPEETPPTRCGRGCSSRDALKVGVSLMTSALLFPFLVWGGFLFLPFDAPLMDGAPFRLIYTLRCSVFAVAPIVLGWLVLGISRLRFGAFRPLFDEQVKGEEFQEVAIHRGFISDSVSLFLVYFLQLVVMAMYLSQENLKLVPLLTVLFAFGRLVYWVAAAFGSSIRGFGFGLSFLPSLVMMVANIYFIFTVEAEGSIFSLSSSAAGKQRFFG